MNKVIAVLGGNALLAGQLLFSITFISSCELPNWIVGPRQMNACLERWYVVTALFFPSAAQRAEIAAADTRRRGGFFGQNPPSS